jgi:hypothetical protein
VCGEARRLASPPETKEPLIIKQFKTDESLRVMLTSVHAA